MHLQNIDRETICKIWGIPPIHTVQEPAYGTLNRIYLLTTVSGTFVLRAYRYPATERGAVKAEHELIAYARRHGLPAIAPLALAGNTQETIYEHNQQLFALFPHAPGFQTPRQHLTIEHAAAMGEMLATLHQRLANYPHTRVTHRSLDVDTPSALATIDQLLTLLQAKEKPEQVDRQALKRLQQRKAYLVQASYYQDAVHFPDEQQVIHGDYHDANLFFDDVSKEREQRAYSVSAIIDWEKAFVAPRTYEVLRTLQYSFSMQTEHTQAFLQAYHRLRPLSLAELDAAAIAYGAITDHQLWLYTAYYFEQNTRVKPLMMHNDTDNFVPFAETWRHLRTTLGATLS